MIVRNALLFQKKHAIKWRIRPKLTAHCGRKADMEKMR